MSKFKKLLILIAVAVTGGGIPVFAKLTYREITPYEMMTIRFFSAWVIFLPFALKNLPRKISDWAKISLAVLPAALNMVLFSYGLQFTTATMSTLIYVFSPIAAAVMVYVIGQEKLNSRKITGILIGFAGMMLLIVAPLNNQQLTATLGTLHGNGLIFLAMILFTAYTVASKHIQKQFSPQTITSILFLNGWLVCAAFGGYTIFNPGRLLELSITTWLSLSYLIFINSVVFFFLYQMTLKLTSAVTISMATYLYPLVTYIWAAFLLREKLTPVMIIAAGLTLAGAYITTTAKTK